MREWCMVVEATEAKVPTKFRKGPLRHQDLMELCFGNNTCTSEYVFLPSVDMLGSDNKDDDVNPAFPTETVGSGGTSGSSCKKRHRVSPTPSSDAPQQSASIRTPS